MKKLTKLFALLLIIPLLSLCFVGCKDKKDNDNWIIVKTITYHQPDATVKNHSYSSTYQLQTKSIEITEEEYNSLASVPNESSFNLYDRIFEGKTIKESLQLLENKKNKILYRLGGTRFSKTIVTDYTVSYVEIQIISEKCVKIRKNDKTIQVTSDFIEIEYFND